MDNLTDLKNIWLSANTDSLPRAAEMLNLIKKYRSTNLAKKIALIIVAVLLTALMVSVVFLYKSSMPSTRVGEVMIIMAGIMLIVTNLRSLGRLHRVKDHTNKEFIAYLEQVQRNRIYYYEKTQVAGLLLTSVGLLLYIYEAVCKDFVLCISAYSLLFIWLLINWLVIRPRAYQRQARKLEETMNKMSKVAKQF